MSRLAVEERVLKVSRWVVIAFLVVITVFPFYYMLMLSFTPIQELLLHPSRLYVSASDVTVSTYREVLASVNDGGQGFTSFLRNSAMVSVATVFLTLLISIPGAYAVARLKFFARRQISALFLAVYLFPAIVLAIPLFVAFAKVGLNESLFGLLLVSCRTVNNTLGWRPAPPPRPSARKLRDMPHSVHASARIGIRAEGSREDLTRSTPRHTVRPEWDTEAMEVLDRRGRRYSVARASASDVPALAALLADDALGVRRESTDLRSYLVAFQEIDRDPHQLLLAVRDENDNVVGTMQLTLIPGLARRGAKRLQIEGVRLAAKTRGTGLGTALFEWAHEYGQRHGAALAQLTTDKTRTDAHRFYDRLGYRASHEGYKRAL